MTRMVHITGSCVTSRAAVRSRTPVPAASEWVMIGQAGNQHHLQLLVSLCFSVPMAACRSGQ